MQIVDRTLELGFAELAGLCLAAQSGDPFALCCGPRREPLEHDVGDSKGLLSNLRLKAILLALGEPLPCVDYHWWT